MRLGAGRAAIAIVVPILGAPKEKPPDFSSGSPLSKRISPGKTAQQHLYDLVWEGAARHYGADMIPPKVQGLINKELALIAQLEYEPYFLTVYDIVTHAREKGILCQGRGSAANSVVCFCLGITGVNPTEVDLLFERFISAERKEPPESTSISSMSGVKR